ncbi:MAG: ferrous iron transport protein A [Lachnospiraceae bacterium]|nr:ferrous iron transport protein A [Roseburia sp.]MCI6888350.1 ferrous iron transport protein A [Lachnospiraceae bacterium]
MVLPLSHLSPGDQGRIVWIASELHRRERLCDLGFLPGETLTCVLQDAHQHLKAYRVGGSLIALRQETANEIFAEILRPPSHTSP